MFIGVSMHFTNSADVPSSALSSDKAPIGVLSSDKAWLTTMITLKCRLTMFKYVFN